ncbi:MAG TPA: outer membrane beta-barrel protein [Steroidobacteraceae bacterium]|nr:outer membrane beta-barrel protein [Steroidobacteraceae bacterium]
MRKSSLATMSLVLASVAGAAHAEDAAKPTAPTFSDVLDASGITLSGYIAPMFEYHTYSGNGTTAPDYNGFTLNQVGLTIAKQPTEGFGGVVNVVDGTNANPYYSIGVSPGSPSLLQAYLQYATGPLTIIAGKYTTLVGAEVVAPTGNTNVSRSLLFSGEPIAQTGVRATFAANSIVTLIAGVNNGWIGSFLYGSEDVGDGNGKTLELGSSFTLSKTLSASLQGYYGRDSIGGSDEFNSWIVDGVVTWAVTDTITLVGSADWAGVSPPSSTGAPAVHWSGFAAYANFALNDAWRVSVRGEYFDDRDGGSLSSADAYIKEGTVTLGYAPAKAFELRLEGRYDTANVPFTLPFYGYKSGVSAYVQGVYKF